MPLRGKKPETIEKRFKAFFYGQPGVGKTFAAIQFPKPYLIDTERGAEQEQYTEMLSSKGGVIFQTVEFKDLITEIKALLTEQHEYKTLIIDPITTIYNNLVAHYNNIMPEQQTKTNKHYMAANKDFQYLINMLLFKLDMNVIMTAHGKDEFSLNGSGGTTFDGYKKLPFMFDLTVEIKHQAGKRIGYVYKTRLKEFEQHSTFDFSYEEIEKRYGKEKIDKESAPLVLATAEQIKRFSELCAQLRYSHNMLISRLEKQNVRSIDELESSVIQTWIDALENKVKPKEESK